MLRANLFGRILALAFLVLPAVAFAQMGDDNVDQRVVRFMTEKGYKYSNLSNGDFKCTFNVEGGRTQLVFVRSVTYKYSGLEIREIYCPIYNDTKRPSQEIMQQLLTDNSRRKIGAWEINYSESSGKYMICFSVKISANADAATLNAMIDLTSEVADEIEKDIYGTDDY